LRDAAAKARVRERISDLSRALQTEILLCATARLRLHCVNDVQHEGGFAQRDVVDERRGACRVYRSRA
jgi:hypothetical protein